MDDQLTMQPVCQSRAANFLCHFCHRYLTKQSWFLPEKYIIPAMAGTEVFYYGCPGCGFRYSLVEVEGK